MAYRRGRRSYRRFFRSKRKSVAWTKETVQIVSVFNPNSVVQSGTTLPPFCISRAIVSNTGGAGGLNAANSLALRTIKNFTINGAFTYSYSTNPFVKKSTEEALQADDDIQIDPQTAVPADMLNVAVMNAPVTWALIYVPQGVAVPYLGNSSFQSLYEPNQNVIDSGVWQPTAGPLRIKSRMARKLHTGDSIYFCAYSWASTYGTKGTGQTSNTAAQGTADLLTTISFCTKCN